MTTEFGNSIVFLLNYTSFVLDMTAFFLELLGFVLNMTGLGQNMAVFLLKKTEFTLLISFASKSD